MNVHIYRTADSPVVVQAVHLTNEWYVQVPIAVDKVDIMTGLDSSTWQWEHSTWITDHERADVELPDNCPLTELLKERGAK